MGKKYRSKKKKIKGGSAPLPGSSSVNYNQATGLSVPQRVTPPRGSNPITIARSLEDVPADAELRTLALHYRAIPTWFRDNMTPVGPPDLSPAPGPGVELPPLLTGMIAGPINTNFIR